MDSVIEYQILFFSLILISSIFGRSARNIVCIGSIIFTLIMIFVNWLLILQLVTIVFGYLVSEYLIEKLKGKGITIAIICFIFFIAIVIITNLPSESNNDYRVTEKTISQPIEDEVLEYNDENLDFNTINNLGYVSDADENEIYEPVADDDYGVDEITLERIGIINSFIDAENERDLNFINSLLNPIVYKFWNKENVSKTEIINSYRKNWTKFPNSQTTILNIKNHPSTPLFYRVEVNYIFGRHQVVNTITFEFNEQNKIISIN